MKTLISKLFALAVLTVLAASCTKQAPSAGNYGDPIDMDQYKKRAMSMVEDIPEFSFYDRTNDREIRVNFNSKSFSFSEPNSGWNYSDDDDLTFVSASLFKFIL